MASLAIKPRHRISSQSRLNDFELTIASQCAGGKAHISYLRRQLSAAYPYIRRPPRELSIALVGDAEMSRLHGEYLDIAEPTDVLTFEIEHEASGRVTSGEVVICVPQARRQAEDKTPGGLKREVLLLALHGLLHLSGFDDKTATAFEKMHRAEDRILGRIGVGRVFHRTVLREKVFKGKMLKGAAPKGKAKMLQSAGVRR